MWKLRSRKRKRLARELAEHRATLAEIEGRFRAARALYDEIKRWPSPLACWLMLQAGQGQPLPRWNPVGQPRELRLNLEARNLPMPVTTRSAPIGRPRSLPGQVVNTRSMRRFR